MSDVLISFTPVFVTENGADEAVHEPPVPPVVTVYEPFWVAIYVCAVAPAMSVPFRYHWIELEAGFTMSILPD
jgi:hypothetical protein